MTPASWVPQKGRHASVERDGCSRELNRGRCSDMWVSPQYHVTITAKAALKFGSEAWVLKKRGTTFRNRKDEIFETLTRNNKIG